MLYPALFALTLASPAEAKPRFFGVLTTTYNSPAVAARTCENCHSPVGPPTLNPYGLSLQAAFGPDREVSVELLRRLESPDSDGDGRSNGEELRAGSEPGTPDAAVLSASNTGLSGTPGPSPDAADAPESARVELREEPTGPSGLIPRHGEHPAFVHFPIALFIAGLALDLAGVLRNHRGLLFAGWCNLVLAAFATLGAMASGALALYLSDIPFDGVIRLHATLGMLGAATLFVLVGMRVHRHERLSSRQRAVYYVLAVAALGLIGGAAHLGGSYVYGE